MANNDTPITVVGNLTADPELRFTPSGAAVATFTVASTPRSYDKTSGQWRDGEPLFLRCQIWRQPAEHAAESLRKGGRVVVVGALRSRSYDDRDGQRRTVFEVEADEVGLSLRFGPARPLNEPPIHRVGAHTGQRQSGPVQDPWSTQPAVDEPPF